MRVFVPVHHAGIGVLDEMAIARQRLVRHALVHDQLYVLDPAVEVRVQVSRERRERDLVLLVVTLVADDFVDRVPEDASSREEAVDEFVPVRDVILPSGALPGLSARANPSCSGSKPTAGKPLKCSPNCMSFSRH